MELKDKNRLIAEFMGLRVNENCAFSKDWDNDNNEIEWSHHLEWLKYNHSWEELIPVIKKCLEAEFYYYVHNSVDYDNSYETKKENFIKVILEFNLNKSFDACADYVDFINRHKNNLIHGKRIY